MEIIIVEMHKPKYIGEGDVKMKKQLKRLLVAVMAMALVVTNFVVAPKKVYAASSASFVSVGGWTESIYAQISGVSDSGVTAVSYAGPVSGSLSGDDLKYLVRDNNGGVRIDIPGLKPGTYTLTVTTTAGTLTKSGLVVTAYDRSGYAHFNYTAGVGAYNDDGTLKDNAIVLYVTDENKNTVTLSYGGVTVTGIGNILNSVGEDVGGGKAANGGTSNTNQGIIKKLADAGIPLVVRFVGIVSDSGLYKRATNNPQKSLIDGLTVYNTTGNGGTAGDNGHMARIKSGKDITLEGIGTDATIDGWGFHFMCSTTDKDTGRGTSFEVRNLTFINTPEDAVGMEGTQGTLKADGTVENASSATADILGSVERCWVHNNEFYCPSISPAAEGDKSEGDGSVDFKRGQYFTCSYNYFEGCHKTNLVGSSDTSLQYNLTYHHNWWRSCGARGPLARRANIHMYNNVFEGQTDYCMNPRATCFIFSEYNLFYKCKNPQDVAGGALKSYNDCFSSCIGSATGTVVTDRKTTVSNSCAFSYRGIDYSKFETDSTLSYIPTGDYAIQEDVTEARKYIAAYNGTMSENPVHVEDVTASDYSVLDAIGASATEITTFPFTAAPGKISKTVYAFKVNTPVTIETTFSGGVLINEAGEAILDASGKITVPAGAYAIQPVNFNCKAFDQTDFKEVTISSISITAADPNYDPNKLTGIELNKTSVTLLADATTTLTVSYTPSTTTDDKTVTWTTSNSSVATVSNGVVTAVGKGTAIITAQVGEFTATCTVTVSDPVALTGISLDKTTMELESGSSDTLTVTYNPTNTTDDTTVTWTSSNASVATVNGGTVKAVGEGTATITAKVGNFTATCTVTVTVPEIPEGAYIHNFTESGKTSDVFSITGNLATSKGTVTYAGLTLTQCLKMESSTSISFTAPADGTLTLVFGGSTSASGSTVKVNGTSYTCDSNSIATVEVKAGTVTITKGGSINLFYMSYAPASTEQPEADADYTAVDTAIASIPSDLSIYTDESAAAVTAAKDAVVRGKKASEQAAVDAMAKAIEDAVAALELKTVTEKKNGLCQNEEDGKWYYYVDDVIDTTKTGLVQGSDSVFWYVNAGVVDTTYTGFITNGAGTWYVISGKIDVTFTGLGQDGDKFIAVFKGKAYPEFTGLIQNAGYFWYVNAGVVDTTYTGFYENSSGKWYVANGKVDTNFKGLGKDGDKWLVVLGGKHDSTYTGLIQNGGAFWYVKSGVLDTTFTGITETGGASWLVATGKLRDDYTGTYTDSTGTYTVVNGKVTQ